MEHRYGKRHSVNSKTLIFKNGMPVAIGRIRNFSRDGIFIETEFDAINVNQLLQIELIRHRGGSSTSAEKRRMLKFIVVHKNSHGIGLMLFENCLETQKKFSEFVVDELSLRADAVIPVGENRDMSVVKG